MSTALLRRFLLILLGCFVSVVATAADNIQWISINLPAAGGAGTMLQFNATVKNTGDTTWDGNCYLELADSAGNHLYYPSVAGVAPGQTVSRMFLLYLPSGTGDKTYTFKGLRHNVAYFGATQSRAITVQAGPVNSGVVLTGTQEAGGVYLLAPAAMPVISTADVMPPHYRLRAKVIDGTQYGWHAAETWNNNNLALDSPLPVPGSYPVTSLYWLKYDAQWGTLLEIGQERFVPVRAPGGVVSLSSYAFGQLTPPTIYTTEPLTSTYWLYAKFKNASGGEWDVTPRPPNAAVNSHNNYHTLNPAHLPPAGDYALELTWKRFDAAGNVVATGPTFTKPLVVIYPGAGVILSGNDSIDWEPDGNGGGDYSVREHTFTPGIDGTMQISVSGSFAITTIVERLNPNGEEEWVAGGGANFSFGVTAGQSFRLRVSSSAGSGSYQVTGILSSTLTAPSFASPALVVNGTVNTQMAQFVGATGSGTVTHAIASGNLPPGLILIAEGHVVGTPTAAGAWTATVRASNSVAQAVRDVTITISAAAGQTITFGNLAGKLVTSPPFTVSATASSGLPVSFSVVSGPATISGSTVTLTGAPGSVTIRASQNGNADYAPATSINRSFLVSAVAPVIVTQPLHQQVAVGAQVQLTVAASGTAPLTYVWHKNGTPISAGVGVSGFDSATLTIAEFAESHAGTYMVEVTNSAGAVTSAPATLTTLIIPAPRAYAADQISSSRFLASWSAVPGAIGYRLDVSSNATFTNLILSNHSPVYVFNGNSSIVTSQTVTGLVPNTDYWYRVRAVTAAGTSPNSSVVTVRTSPSTPSSPSLWFDKPVDVRVNNVWTKVYDGLKDEIIPAGGSHGLTYYVLDYRYTGGTVTFYDNDFPTNDWWYPRNVGFDFNGDGISDENRPAFTPLWQSGITFSYTGEIYQRIGVEFDPEPGYFYEVCYSQNDIISPTSLGVVSGGGHIFAENANRMIFALFNEFTIPELERGSLYLVRHSYAPGGCVMSLPGIGSVTAGAGGAASGTITLPGGIKVTAGTGSSSNASITFPGGGNVTVNSTGQVTGTLPSGHSVTIDSSGQATVTLPNGVTIKPATGDVTIAGPSGAAVTVGAGGIKVQLPQGLGGIISDAIDEFGKVLGIGSSSSNVRIKVGDGDWNPIGGDLSTLPAGIYPVGVTSDTRGVPEARNIVTFTLTILPPAKILRAVAAATLDYQPIAGPLANALPGQKIHLRLDVAEGVPATDVQWMLPGTTFKNYTANRDTGILVQMAPADLSGTDANLYWADGGVKTVTVRFRTLGVQRQISAGMMVLPPTATFITTSMGQPTFANFGGNDTIGLFSETSPPGTPGVKFNGNVVNPPGFEGGGWHWVQTVVSSATIVDHDNIRRRLRIHGQLALDSTYPYQPTEFENPNRYYPVSEAHATEDTPHELLVTSVPLPGNPANGIARRQVAFENESFFMYLMYLPPGHDSRFVPLKCVQWSFRITAIRQGDSNWTSDPSSRGKNVTTAADCSVHPQWTKNIRDYLSATLEFWDPY